MSGQLRRALRPAAKVRFSQSMRQPLLLGRWLTLVFFHVLRSSVALQPTTVSEVQGGIPRIIHQMFLSGHTAMQREVQAGTFKPTWWRSCKAHHPTWRYILWDIDSGEEFLEHAYPWYLPLFRRISSVVMLSDALRIFILHAYGGVYLDMDTECYGSIEDSLAGHSLVLPSEEEDLVNNAQMASVPRHPFLSLMMGQAKHAVESGRFDSIGPDVVLEATGPKAMTHVLREYLLIHNQTLHPSLHGRYPDVGLPARNGQPTTIMIQPKGAWFTPCTYNDTDCGGALSRCAVIVRALNLCSWHRRHSSGSALDRGCPDNNTQPTQLQQLCRWQTDRRANRPAAQTGSLEVSCAQRFGQLVGLHHYSNTWLGANGTKHIEIQRQGLQGQVSYFKSASAFVETAPFCVPPAPASVGAQPPVTSSRDATLAWAEWLQRALSPLEHMAGTTTVDNGCWMVSIFQSACRKRAPEGASFCCSPTEPLAARTSRQLHLIRLAAQYRCHLTIITDSSPNTLYTALGIHASDPALKIIQGQLMTGDDSVDSTSKESSLKGLLETWMRHNPSDHPRLDVLHIAAPGSCTWRAIVQLERQGFIFMKQLQPPVVLLELGSLVKRQGHLVTNFYTFMQQSLDYLGHAHHAYNTSLIHEPDSRARANTACPVCDRLPAANGTNASLLPHLWLGFVRRRTLQGVVSAA